jgi:hypothetical protein
MIMIKMISAFTEEIDDVDLAVSEILNRLDLGNNALFQNSIGILHCYNEFVDSGVVKALSEKLPFDVIGATMNSVCESGNMSEMGLMLNILTSDDVNFITGVSGAVDSDMPAAMKKLSDGINSRLNEGEKPAMLLTFIPLMLTIGADEFVDQINKLFDNIPAFGALPISEEADFSKCYMLYNGEYYENIAIITALTGNVKPQFLTASFPEKNMLRQRGIVTKSESTVLHCVNGMSFEEYAESSGLVDKKEDIPKLISTPIIVDLDNGLRLVRVCFTGNGSGGALMGGHIPEGAKIGFSVMDSADIVNTTGQKIEEALETADGRNLLIYACSARLWALGPNNTSENDKIIDIIGDSASYYSTYCGGEIFPQWLPDGKVVNHLQNYSLIICMI